MKLFDEISAKRTASTLRWKFLQSFVMESPMSPLMAACLINVWTPCFSTTTLEAH